MNQLLLYSLIILLVVVDDASAGTYGYFCCEDAILDGLTCCSESEAVYTRCGWTCFNTDVSDDGLNRYLCGTRSYTSDKFTCQFCLEESLIVCAPGYSLASDAHVCVADDHQKCDDTSGNTNTSGYANSTAAAAAAAADDSDNCNWFFCPWGEWHWVFTVGLILAAVFVLILFFQYCSAKPYTSAYHRGDRMT